jgi:hypothetical protein
VHDPSVIAAGTTAGSQNRCPEQPPHAQAVCHSVILAGFLECRRDNSSKARPFETKTFSRDRDSRREFSTRVQHWVRGSASSDSSSGKTRNTPHSAIVITAETSANALLLTVYPVPAYSNAAQETPHSTSEDWLASQPEDFRKLHIPLSPATSRTRLGNLRTFSTQLRAASMDESLMWTAFCCDDVGWRAYLGTSQRNHDHRCSKSLPWTALVYTLPMVLAVNWSLRFFR